MLFFWFGVQQTKEILSLTGRKFAVTGSWCYGNSTATGECHPALWGDVQVSIHLAAVFRCQQNPSDPHFWPTGRILFWSWKQHSVDYPFRGSTHTRHFGVLVLPVTFSPFLFCVLSWREVKCSWETVAAKWKTRVLSPVRVCNESSVFMCHRLFPAFIQCYKIAEDKFIEGAVISIYYLPVYCWVCYAVQINF